MIIFRSVFEMKKYILANFADDSKKEVGFYLVVLNAEHEYLTEYADDARECIAQARKTQSENIRILDYSFFGSYLGFLEGCEATQGCVRSRTAKDLAWDKERSKLRAIIHSREEACSELRSELSERDCRIKNLEDVVQEQHAIISELQKLHDLSDEDVKVLIDHKKNQNHAIDFFDSLASMSRFFPNY